MANMLDGIEFRTYTATHGWTAWETCPNNTNTFGGTLDFRVKPIYKYEVWSNGKVQTNTSDKNKAMSLLASLVETEHKASIERVQVPTQTIGELFAARKIQFRLHEDQDWRDGKYLPSGVTTGTLQFRLRPDHYWEVRVGTDVVSNSTLTFDDPVKLARYLNNYACSNNTSSLSVYPRKYDVV